MPVVSEVTKTDKRWKQRYPWSTWFATQSLGFQVDRTKNEFFGRTDTFVQQIRNQCYKVYHRKANITVSDDGNIITVTFK